MLVYTLGGILQDKSFDELLDEYFENPPETNSVYSNVEIHWIEGRAEVGVGHISSKHQVTKSEVEEVIFELPPEVQAKAHPDHPDRTIFWGCTREGRWIFIVCEDRMTAELRTLTPITAFEPDEGEEYWGQYA